MKENILLGYIFIICILLFGGIFFAVIDLKNSSEQRIYEIENNLMCDNLMTTDNGYSCCIECKKQNMTFIEKENKQPSFGLPSYKNSCFCIEGAFKRQVFPIEETTN